MRREGMTIPGMSNYPQQIYPMTEKDAAQARVPWFLPFEPAAAIVAGATGQVDQTISWQDFVCTKIGFTSETVGFPAAAGRWRVQIQDIGASKNFQPEGFNITALIGGNFGVSDNLAADLPVPWIFMEKTTVRVLLENINALNAIPTLLLIGYLTNWEREATAALAQQELMLKVLKREAGEPVDSNRWG